MISEANLEKIIKICGKKNVLTDELSRFCYSFDATAKSYLPDIVVFIEDEDQLCELTSFANENKIYLTPRGAGTGFSGGAIPIYGGIVLSFERMNKIIDIDFKNLIAIVEVGVNTYEFKEKLKEYNLFYPPDPASQKISTIGGNVAECAGGPLGLKYGVTKDYVLGIYAILPTGDKIKTGVRTKKGVVGYDLTKLLVGSEGTLAIFTKIILKLLPLPSSFKTAFIIFKDAASAANCIPEIIKKGILPSTLEFMDFYSLKCIEDLLNFKLTKFSSALLIELDGDEEILNKKMRKIKDICIKYKTEEIFLAQSEDERESLWEARRAISPAISRIFKDKRKVNEDIVVPQSKIPEILDKLYKIAEKYGYDIVVFGHAGDGNLHVNLMVKKDEKEEKISEAIYEIFVSTLSLGGSISGEHGIGFTKSKFIKLEIGEKEYNLMKKMKKIFDPRNILNPGKIF